MIIFVGCAARYNRRTHPVTPPNSHIHHTHTHTHKRPSCIGVCMDAVATLCSCVPVIWPSWSDSNLRITKQTNKQTAPPVLHSIDLSADLTVLPRDGIAWHTVYCTLHTEHNTGDGGVLLVCDDGTVRAMLPRIHRVSEEPGS